MWSASRFDGELITPKSLNVWLMANKGYVCAAGGPVAPALFLCRNPRESLTIRAGDCNNLVLDSISRLNSSVTLIGESKHSWDDLVKYVAGPFAVLLHVRNNHHFVLATGLASSPLTFTVHDPMLYTDELTTSWRSDEVVISVSHMSQEHMSHIRVRARFRRRRCSARASQTISRTFRDCFPHLWVHIECPERGSHFFQQLRESSLCSVLRCALPKVAISPASTPPARCSAQQWRS